MKSTSKSSLCNCKRNMKSFSELLKVDEPFGLLRSVAFFAGALRDKVDPLYIKYTYIILIYYYYVLVSFVFGPIPTAMSVSATAKEGTEAINFMIGGSAFALSHHILQYPPKELLEVMEDLKQLWYTLKPHHGEILNHYLQKANKALVTVALQGPFMLALSFFFVAIYNVYISDPPIKKLPLEIWLPNYFHEHQLIGSIIQVWFIYLYGMFALMVGSTFVHMITIHIYGLSLAVSKELSQLSNMTSREKIVNTYKSHKILTKSVFQISNLFKYIWCVQITFFPPIIILPLFRFVKDLHHIDESLELIFAHIFTVVLNFFVTFNSFNAGHLIKDAGEKLSEAFYQNNWLLADVKQRKELLIMGLVINRGLSYEYRGVFTLNRSTSSRLFQAIYSYFNMIWKLDPK